MIVASEAPTVKAAVLFSPFLVHSRRLGLIAALWPVLSLGVKYLTGGGAVRSIRNPDARASFIAYGCSTPRLLREVQRIVRRARAALPQVNQPVWIAQSGDDYRISADQAQQAFDHLGSGDKRLHWTTGNGHVITVDYGHEELASEATRWLESRVPAR
jgi:esterase/lipase